MFLFPEGSFISMVAGEVGGSCYAAISQPCSPCKKNSPHTQTIITVPAYLELPSFISKLIQTITFFKGIRGIHYYFY